MRGMRLEGKVAGGDQVRARLLTRCGCERIIEVPWPPPPEWHVPLRTPKTNEGLLRPWMRNLGATYDPMRDGPERRVFKLDLSSVRYKEDKEDEVWYDEYMTFDPPGYDAAKRTYRPEEEKR